MATLTNNIGLTKPDLRENVLLSVLNGNSDIIDAEVKSLQDKTVNASDTTEGIISLNGVRDIVSELSGGEYVQAFGSSLTSLQAGKTYLYIDANGKGVIYVALTNATNPTGFLAPDSTNFYDISNVTLKNSIDSINGLVFGNTMIQGTTLTSGIPYLAPSGYIIRSITATHIGIDTTVNIIISLAGNNTQYQINTNHSTAVSCSAIIIFEKV